MLKSFPRRARSRYRSRRRSAKGRKIRISRGLHRRIGRWFCVAARRRWDQLKPERKTDRSPSEDAHRRRRKKGEKVSKMRFGVGDGSEHTSRKVGPRASRSHAERNPGQISKGPRRLASCGPSHRGSVEDGKAGRAFSKEDRTP